MEDIAREAGVSRRAVSRVLFPNGSRGVRVSEKTALKIQEIAKRLGYLPNLSARQLAGEKSHLVGVLIDSFGSAVSYLMLQQLERSMAALGYRLLIGQVHNDVDSIGEYLRDFTSRGVEGIISFVHHYPGHGAKIREIYRPMENVVCIGDSVVPGRENPAADTARVDIAEGIRMLVRHLHETGRRRIALFLSEGGYISAKVRELEFLSQIDALSLDPASCPVWSFRREEGKGPSREAIHEGLSRLLSAHPETDAIIASNDLVALCTIQFLGLRGIGVPDRVAVTGFDNLELGWASSPPITTVDQSPEQVAQKAIELLLRRVGSPDAEPRSVSIPPRLIVRESTLPATKKRTTSPPRP